jgi:uncharacterized C2H2 Zn-finger protein
VAASFYNRAVALCVISVLYRIRKQFPDHRNKAQYWRFRQAMRQIIIQE